MKKVLFYARDPGGANAIIPLVKKIQKRYQVLLYGKDVALHKYKIYGLQGIDIVDECQEITEKNIQVFLKKKAPCFIITETGGADAIKKYLWNEGEKLGIPSFAVLDQWVNCAMRFAKYDPSEIDYYKHERIFEYLPTRIMVMDEYAKGIMVEAGIPDKKIIVSGQPYFEQLKEDIESIKKNELIWCRDRWKCKNDELVFIFASEPITEHYKSDKGQFGYSERSIFKIFCSVLEKKAEEKKKKVKVIVRPHPKEKREWWDSFLKNSKYVSYCIDDTTDSRIAMIAADVICGMTSMFLIESAMCKKAIMSIQIGLNEENSFILEKKGILSSILNEEKLEQCIQNILEDKYFICEMDIPTGATDVIINEMERWI